MANAVALQRQAGKANATSVLEADVILVGGLALTASGTASIYNDTFTSSVTIGGGATAAGAAQTVAVTGGTPAAADTAGGAVSTTGGDGNGTGAGGAATLTGGDSGAGATGDGGAAGVVGGAATSTNGSGGAADLTGGLATGTGTGGGVTLTSGASGGAGGTAGSLSFQTGAPAGGTEGAINIGTTQSPAITMGGTGAGAVVINSGSTLDIGDGANTGAVTLNSASTIAIGDGSAGAVTIDSGAGVSVGGAAASDFTTTAGALTLDGAGGVNIAGNAAEVDVTTSGALDLNSGAFTLDCSTAVITPTSTFDVEATGAIGIDSSAGINVGDTNATAVQVGRAGITVTIPGDLVVQGTTTSVDNENMQTQDNHIYLNKDYTAVSGQTGGLALNYLPTATTDTSNTGGFATTTTVNTVGAATFAAGDFVQVSSAANPANDGVYEVSTHAANVLTINGTPTHRFCNTAFTVDAGDTTAALTHINISVIQSNTTGDWELGKGDDQAALTASLSTIGAGAGNSLNAAYLVGATITTTGGQGNVIVAGTEALQVTATGGLDVDTLIDFDGSSLDAVASGAISLDAGAASNFSVSGAGIDLTLASAAGRVVMDGGEAAADAVTIVASNAAGGIDIDAGATSGTVTINSGGATTITSAGINLAGGASEIDLTTTGALDLNSGAFTLDASTVAITPTSTFDVQATGAVTIDSSGSTIGLGTDADTGAINIGTSATARTITMGSTSSTEVDLTGILVDINGGTGGVTIDAAATGDIALTVADNAGSDITFQAHGSAIIEFNDTTDVDLDAGFTATSIIGALNELKTTSATGSTLETTYTNGNAGAITQGEVVYKNGTDGEVDLADASANSTASVIGVVEDASIASAGSGQIITHGQVSMAMDAATYVAGEEIFLSETAGQGTNTAPTGNPNSGVVVLSLGFVVTGATVGAGGLVTVQLVRGSKIVL